MSKNEIPRLYTIADNVYAKTVYIGGEIDAPMVNVTMTEDQKKIRMIKLIQTSRQEKHGASGISPGNRRIGVEAVTSMKYHTVKILLSTKAKQ